MTEQEIKEILESLDCKTCEKLCAKCDVLSRMAHELWLKLNQPVPDNLREGIAQYLYSISPIPFAMTANEPWDKMRYPQVKIRYYKQADSVLSLIQPVIEQAILKGMNDKIPEARAEFYRSMRVEIDTKIEQAREEGRKEVVEWISNNAELEQCDHETMAYFADYYALDKADWQAKLKEWGLSKEAQSE
jgi:hypothetical protein